MGQTNRTCQWRTNRFVSELKRAPNLLRDTYDRSAVMKRAWREWNYARSRGWHIGLDATTFAACLRIAHGMERAAWQRAVWAMQAQLMGVAA